MGYNDQQPSSSPDPLIGRERIRGASRMIAEGTEAGKVTPEQIDHVRSDAETFRRARQDQPESHCQGNRLFHQRGL